ncbi:hypothetical protein MNBD_NITROSPINAE01-1441 [hydrothermal vent metagenome]|uniref:Uncharacterized protein n=1 Tax=hydrothermal vent metagenome TaxID=652676 RepID=A0A3B1BMH6_9ZZZZ
MALHLMKCIMATGRRIWRYELSIGIHLEYAAKGLYRKCKIFGRG